MKRLLSLICAAVLAWTPAGAQLTLDRCMELADGNYPLIKKYGLVDKTTALKLSDINRGWLPRVAVGAQATIQNAVPEFPDVLTGMLSQLGQNFEGMGHVQYKVGVDVSQTIWDGGASKSRRESERAAAEASRAALDVEMYAMHGKVQELFFAILLLDEQMEQTRATIELLEANNRRVEAMLTGGTAMQSDVDQVEAQLLAMHQQLTQAQGAADGYRRMLEIYTGERLAGVALVRPDATMPADMTGNRPEQRLFDARETANNARLGATDVSVMPKVGFFAQAYYGYPGMNYFESMRNRDMSVNAIAGVKLSWNIDSFYTRSNSRKGIAADMADIAADREMFEFGTGLQSAAQQAAIGSLQKVVAEDGRIVELRERVRKAAESQLVNGVIDATDLLARITDENMARLNARYHEIQLLQSICQLKYTLNR